MKERIKKNAGFTIIETMISVSIFTIVVTIGMGALLNANLIHGKSQNMRSIMDNMSFIMEDMSRNLRTGTVYHCGAGSIVSAQSCESGDTILFFEEAHGKTGVGDQWGYEIVNEKIFKYIKGTDLLGQVQLTPDEVVVDTDKSKFIVIGAELDNQQPFVTIRLVGTINYKGVITPFSLQTSVSQRGIDI